MALQSLKVVPPDPVSYDRQARDGKKQYSQTFTALLSHNFGAIGPVEFLKCYSVLEIHG
jgi:hypothetical protein